MDTAGIVLAAGAGTRMKSKRPKVTHELLGRPLVMWPICALKEAGIADICVVVGPEDTQVSELVSGAAHTAVQQQKLGTADATKAAMDTAELATFEGNVVLVYGDCPLLSADTIRHLVDVRIQEDAACVVLTFKVEEPFGYGRIIARIRSHPMCLQARSWPSWRRRMLMRSKRACANAIRASTASMPLR